MSLFNKTYCFCRSLKIIGFIIITFLFNGCAFILGGSKTTRFKTTTSGSSIELSSSVNEDYEKIGVDSVKYRLNNANNYILRQQKEGYKSQTQIVYPKKINPGKIIGYTIPAVAAITFLSMVTNEKESIVPIKVPSFFTGIFGWLLFPLGPSKMHEGSFILPKLSPLPGKGEKEKYLFVDQTNVKIDKENYRHVYYDNPNDFFNNNQLHSSSFTEKIDYENVSLTADLNKLLVKYQYSDTTKKLVPTTYNSLKIKCDIVGITSNVVENFFFIDMNTKWSLSNYYDEKDIIVKEIPSRSNWTFSYSDKNPLGVHIIDALESSLTAFLGDTAVKMHLKSDVESFKKIYDEWTDIKVNSTKTANSVSEAAKAVVTIKIKDGHGSGCLISRQGYILTNYHVTGDSPTDMEIIFENGTKAKGQVVRTNPMYDLALIKTDSVNIKPLKINREKNIEVGKEMFAIGTPTDIELGQTVSKGIISGKRKVDDKIYIQTDVSINKGNSGGALIDKDGILSGVVNAKFIGLGVEGIGFAIPAYYIQEALKIDSN